MFSSSVVLTGFMVDKLPRSSCVNYHSISSVYSFVYHRREGQKFRYTPQLRDPGVPQTGIKLRQRYDTMRVSVRQFLAHLLSGDKGTLKVLLAADFQLRQTIR